jgi:hypothetical protein
MKHLLILAATVLSIGCASTIEFYTTAPRVPDFLKDKEIVSIDTIYIYKGVSYIYNYREPEKEKSK